MDTASLSDTWQQVKVAIYHSQVVNNDFLGRLHAFGPEY